MIELVVGCYFDWIWLTVCLLLCCLVLLLLIVLYWLFCFVLIELVDLDCFRFECYCCFC